MRARCLAEAGVSPTVSMQSSIYTVRPELICFSFLQFRLNKLHHEGQTQYRFDIC